MRVQAHFDKVEATLHILPPHSSSLSDSPLEPLPRRLSRAETGSSTCVDMTCYRKLTPWNCAYCAFANENARERKMCVCALVFMSTLVIHAHSPGSMHAGRAPTRAPLDACRPGKKFLCPSFSSCVSSTAFYPCGRCFPRAPHHRLHLAVAFALRPVCRGPDHQSHRQRHDHVSVCLSECVCVCTGTIHRQMQTDRLTDRSTQMSLEQPSPSRS